GYTIYKGYLIKMLKNIGISLYKKILYFAYLTTHNKKIMSKYTTLIEEKSNFETTYIPYGVAIAIGTLIVLTGYHLGYAPFI
ncbi:MAG: hypothetical protein K0M69_15520, partial [Youngiibacter sp.]|nr:hypothetical protein [Youngiibacter sp.]